VAACRAIGQHPAALILESIGGALGGYLGATLPDGVEPASLGWNHRGFCHSWSALIAGVAATHASVVQWESFCRKRATELSNRLNTAGYLSDLERLILALELVIWTIAAGVLSGLFTGYASHLLLDSFTPAQLPFA
jgi:membrane-bound metal-dependent hydrolase YbcI (DUF457 family)